MCVRVRVRECVWETSGVPGSISGNIYIMGRQRRCIWYTTLIVGRNEIQNVVNNLPFSITLISVL